jgi:hypothetical protein
MGDRLARCGGARVGIERVAPIGELPDANLQGAIKGLVEAAPDTTWRFGDLIRFLCDLRVVATPEQIADHLQT